MTSKILGINIKYYAAGAAAATVAAVAADAAGRAAVADAVWRAAVAEATGEGCCCYFFVTNKRRSKHAHITTCLEYGVRVGGVLWDCWGEWGFEGKRIDTATPYCTDAYYF